MQKRPTAPIKRFVIGEFIICLDGGKFRSLRRHLRVYRLTPTISGEVEARRTAVLR
nr:MucR family transcriptional regulator [Sinorhizobium medicae]